MRSFLLLACLSLAACAPMAVGNNTAAATEIGDQVVLKSATGLSLGELAFTSAEQAATAALKSGRLSKADAAALDAGVLTARGYRNQARAAVQAGQDASAILTSLDAAIVKIAPLTTKGS